MLVANPAASQFTGGDHRAIVRILSRRHLVEAVWPASAAEARSVAADAVTAGFDGVVAMGGDGIVHQVAQSLIGTDLYLGIIPAGTTNVLARLVGIPLRPRGAARLLAAQADVSPLPVLAVTTRLLDGNSRTDHALFALGLGLDADVVAAAEAEPYRKYRFGALHYARTSLSLFWSDLRKRQPALTVEEGNRQAMAVGVMAQVHDAFTYFGPRPLRFGAGTPDPVDLLIIERLPLRRLPALLARVGAGRSFDRVKGLSVWRRVSEFAVTATGSTRLEIDGEVIGDVVSAQVSYLPDALWVAGLERKTPSS